MHILGSFGLVSTLELLFNALDRPYLGLAARKPDIYVPCFLANE